MKVTITIFHSPSCEVEAKYEQSPYCDGDTVYLVPNNVSLQDYAQEYKNEIAMLKKRYKYLEKARGWIIKNIKGME
jgi:hypothetical protein